MSFVDTSVLRLDRTLKKTVFIYPVMPLLSKKQNLKIKFLPGIFVASKTKFGCCFFVDNSVLRRDGTFK